MALCNDTFCWSSDAVDSPVDNEDASPSSDDRDLAVIVIQSALMAMILLLSMVGNALVLTAIYRDKLLRTTASVYVANLATADFLNGGLTMPFILACSIVGRWPFGPVLCSLIGALTTLFCSVSVFTLGTIALDRYVAIVYPLKYTTMMTRRKIISLISVTWVHAIALSILPVIGWSSYIYTDKEYLCTADWGGTLSYTLTVFAVDLGLPLSTMSFCYYHILKTARRQARRVAALRVPHADEQNANSARKAPNPRTKRTKSDMKAAMTLLAVIGTFLFCWLPHTVTMVCLGRPSHCNMPDAVFVVSTWLAMSNSACNPLIYGILNRQFRQAFRDILCGWKARRGKFLR